MDIFEEVKEAVLAATPGEDTRNYYRNQGMATERERIIKLLESSLIALPWEGIFWNEETMGKSLSVDVHDIIELIKGETR